MDSLVSVQRFRDSELPRFQGAHRARPGVTRHSSGAGMMLWRCRNEKRKKGAGLCPFFPQVCLAWRALNLTLGAPGLSLLTQLGSATLLTWLFIMLASTKLLLHSAALNQFFEATECHSYRFSVMYPHA